MERITEIVEGKQEGEKGEEVKNDETNSRSETHKTKSYGISIDCGLIPSVPVNEQASALRDLNVNVFNQEEFEEGVIKQVDQAIAIRETEELVRCWEKDLKGVDEDISTVTSEIQGIEKILNSYEGKSGSGFVAGRKFLAAQKQKDNKLRQLKKLRATQKSLHLKLGVGEDGEMDNEGISESLDGSAQCVTEDVQPQLIRKGQSERDVLVKTGQMTPFGGTIGDIKGRTHCQNVAMTVCSSPWNPREQASDKYYLGESIVKERLHETCKETTGDESLVSHSKKRKAVYVDYDDCVPEENESKCSWYEDDDEAYKGKTFSQKVKRTKHVTLNVSYTDEDDIKPNKTKKKICTTGRKVGVKPIDDGNEKIYRKRIRQLRIKELLKKREQPQGSTTIDEEDYPDMEFDKGLKIPGKIWHQLYKYQQTGVQWLWELHCQEAGGIVGDEMGLGKTIQMIVFLAGLKYSKISARKSRRRGLGPVLIVCPVTVLHQWVQEFHKWWPEFRVAVLHETGTYQGFKQELIRKLCGENGVLVTSYSGVRQHQEHLLTEKFDYIILDEGHKIRNPDAEITIACKQFRTPHRIILSGSPMQNNLRELWSLFDFVFPGKLGTLPVFMTEFSVPITMGGYSNASKVQVETAYKCACVLRDTINPYLLRRLKKDVKMSLELPSKNEQVLFCRLTDEQRELYEQYLDSKEVQAILAGNFKVFPGLIMLRKICNHPDLTSEAGSLVKAKKDCLQSELVGRGEAHEPHPDEGYGDWRRSGKMIVVEALLKMWHQQGHRVLVFSQTRQMLNILEQFVSSKGYTYFRMDGSTPVASRQPLIKTFNQDNSISLFLLTTRVGGLGVNLVGADRIIIYDPDWNPSTDTQARERAWRIGQSKPVTIYRLLTTGTIEEKIYHRQIFKQFLTNRVLSDPKQRRFFKSNDLYELFTLDACDKRYGTETSAIFAGSNCEVKVPGSHKVKRGTREKRLERQKAAKVRSGVENKVERKQCSNSGGGFCVDWRDAEETKNLCKTEVEEKQSEEEDKKDVNEDGQNVLTSRAMGDSLEKVSTVATDVQPSGGDGCSAASNDQDRATGVACVEMPDIYTVLGKCSRKSGTSTSSVVAEASAQGSVSSADCKPTKLRKKRISSLSDEELRMRIKLKEKKKRRRRTNLDGHQIEHLDYHEIFNPNNSSQSSAEEMEQSKQQSAHQDHFILRQLFKKTGVHSALKHDVIMESSNPDLALVESEANRVAENAVKALKRSRQRCLGATSGVPTWTGVSGGSGFSTPLAKRPRFGQKSSMRKANPISNEPVKEEALDPKPHFSGDLMGMKSATEQTLEPEHSSQLLAKMRARNNLQTSDQCSARAVGEKKDNLLVEMRNFVALQGSVVGQATTEEILDEFGSRLPKSDSAVFRSMLRKICKFSRDSTGQGIWTLNSDFT